MLTLDVGSVTEDLDVSVLSIVNQVDSWFFCVVEEEEFVVDKSKSERSELRDTTVPLLSIIEGGEGGNEGRVSRRTVSLW